MRRPLGLFVGYRKFAVDPEWRRQQAQRREDERRRRFEQWSKTWITVTRLKTDRLWTDGAIAQWLGAPIQQGNYKVFRVEAVKAAERKKAFKDWHGPRLEKKRAARAFFDIPTL